MQMPSCSGTSVTRQPASSRSDTCTSALRALMRSASSERFTWASNLVSRRSLERSRLPLPPAMRVWARPVAVTALASRAPSSGPSFEGGSGSGSSSWTSTSAMSWLVMPRSLLRVATSTSPRAALPRSGSACGLSVFLGEDAGLADDRRWAWRWKGSDAPPWKSPDERVPAGMVDVGDSNCDAINGVRGCAAVAGVGGRALISDFHTARTRP
mmetsp:Transcript_4973/g.14672  ORF Transcript_4973/g.14672 Transcript_4973/m.14672 type:complete len:212 (-) Transcript_4973:41-676(-)